MIRRVFVLILISFILAPLTHGAKFGAGSEEAKAERKENLGPRSGADARRAPFDFQYSGPKLDLAIPILDPGLPKDQTKWESSGIQPELRRAEAVWYAKKIARAIEMTGVFNTVRVVPDGSASADFYLLGEIKKSNGEDFKLDFDLYDTTGKKLRIKTKSKKKGLKINVRVPSLWYQDPATSDQDPLEPHYLELAKKIADQMVALNDKDQKRAERNEKYVSSGKFKKVKPLELEKVTWVRQAIYAQYLSEEEFSDVLSTKKGISKLKYIPNFDQDNWQRVRSIIEVDHAFTRLMDQNYDSLTEDMSETYKTYLKDAYTIASRARKDREARNAAIVGAIFSAAAAGAMASNSNSTAGQTAAATMAVASAAAVIKSIEESKDYREQKERLNELGASVSATLSPKVIEMEGVEVKLTGTASEQQAQWKTLMKELFVEGSGDVESIEIIEVS